MALSNCPSCDKLFVKSAFREVCDACHKEEEKAFDLVYTFIRKKENRTAFINQVVAGTGVSERLIYKFIKKGRLNLVHFPNIGYPCEKCGATIREGKLCSNCTDEIKSDLKQVQTEEEIRQKNLTPTHKATYYTEHD